MKRNSNNLKWLTLLFLLVVGFMMLPERSAYAAQEVKIVAVSYTDESILVLNNSNSRIYYATELDASKNKWDVMDAEGVISVIDISWLSPNTENILVIRGDDPSKQVRTIIKRSPLKLEVEINYSELENLNSNDGIGDLLNIRATEGNGNSPLTFDELQWKKGSSGRWLDTRLLTKGLFESYLIKGTNLYFRIAPKDDAATGSVNLSSATAMYAYTRPYFYIDTDGDGEIEDKPEDKDITFTAYPDGTKGRRASNEVKLKINKQAALPVIGVDGSKFTVAIKYGQEYRVNGVPSKWEKVTDRSIKRLTLSEMLGGSENGITVSFPTMKIEIRTSATAKASASKITETNLSLQRVLPNGIIKQEEPPAGVTALDSNIYITYNGTKNLNLTIPSASSDNPYEYTVVKGPVLDLDLTKASWTAVNKGTLVKIPSTKAVDDSRLYIRKKEIKYKAATSGNTAIPFQLASTAQSMDVKYPSVPGSDKTTLVYTKGYPKETKFSITLNTKGKPPHETKIKSIKLGTKDVAVTSTEISPDITGGIDLDEVYIMTVILNTAELEKMPNSTAKALSIYFENGTVDKTSVKLTIKNPTPASSLTVKLEPGTNTGTTAVTVVNPIDGDKNELVYKVTTEEIKGVNVEDTLTDGTALPAEISITADSYLTIYEINKTTKNVVKYKSVKVTADKIKQP